MKAGYWLALWMSLLFANGLQAEADPAVAEALHDYFDFADAVNYLNIDQVAGFRCR